MCSVPSSAAMPQASVCRETSGSFQSPESVFCGVFNNDSPSPADPQPRTDAICPLPHRHRGCTGSFRNRPELSTQSRNLAPGWPRAPPPQAARPVAASSPHWTVHTQGAATHACLPGTCRNLLGEPAALPVTPGLSREASPCSVCPLESPPRPRQLHHSGSQPQVTRDTGHQGEGTATFSLLMT